MNLKVYYKDVDKLPNEEYALIRKNSFGASDIASLLGVGFNTLEDLIAQKQQKFLTDEEKEIGNKPNVKKGRDLEDLILKKYCTALNVEATKPTDMYEVYQGLTVNFDAIRKDIEIPVEIKYVSTFGGKYWTRDTENLIHDVGMCETPTTDLIDHIESRAAFYGIPKYYYTQIQVQIAALNAPYGHLCALFDKDWEIQIYKIPYDPVLAFKTNKAVTLYYPLIGEKNEETQKVQEPSEQSFTY